MINSKKIKDNFNLLESTGSYDPKLERDACGVGLVAKITGEPSHDIVEKSLKALCNLEHRGASGADPDTGDGAGILIQIPHDFFRDHLNYLNIELRRLRSSFFKKYLENYQRALSSRDVEKYVDGEADVVDYEKIINEFALLRNKWLGLLKGLDQKQWQITNVVKLRVAGMEDASL